MVSSGLGPYSWRDHGRHRQLQVACQLTRYCRCCYLLYDSIRLARAGLVVWPLQSILLLIIDYPHHTQALLPQISIFTEAAVVVFNLVKVL